MQTKTKTFTLACAVAAGLTALAAGLRPTPALSALQPSAPSPSSAAGTAEALPAAQPGLPRTASLTSTGPATPVASFPDLEASRSASQLAAASPEELRTIVATSDDVAEVHGAAYQMANRMQLSDADVDALLGRLGALGPEAYGARRTILWALSLRTDRVPVATFGDIAARDAFPEVRRAALRTLGCVATPEAMAVLEVSAFEDDDPENRGEAVSLLGFDADAADPLGLALRGLAAESDPDVRVRWLAYVGMQRPAGHVALLEGLENEASESEQVRQLAADLLELAREG